MNNFVKFIFLCCMLYAQGLLAITPNPVISRGKPAFTSSGAAAYLVDNLFTGTSFTVANNTWLAVNVGTGRSRLFVTWNSPGYSWSDVISAATSCKSNTGIPVNYSIQTSANSTNGANGTWTTVATIANNNVTARGHEIAFANASWVKMSIANGSGQINEVEVFDRSAETTDSWLFVGTSISANAFKATVPARNFADIIAAAHPGYTPSMVRAGIPCINSATLAADVAKYIEVAGNVKYWAIEMGTNDGYNNGNSNVAAFKRNMQTVITACKAAGITPIIARVIGTNVAAAKWQIHPDYITAVDDLTKTNGLIAGPDFYTWFSTHPNDLGSDGIHPNASGAASIQRLWAEKMAALYTPVTAVGDRTNDQNSSRLFPNPAPEGKFEVALSKNVTETPMEIYDMKGNLAWKKLVQHGEQLSTNLSPGEYLVKLGSNADTTTHKLIVK